MLSHRLKLDRALEHLQALNEFEQCWREREPCTVIAKSKIKTHEQVWRIAVVEPAPVERMAMLIGDTLHNLRQSLDHLAFAIAAKVRGAEPPENTGFPIAETPTKFTGSLGNVAPKKLMPQGMATAFERVQPYKGGDYVLLDALKQLHDADKHRKPTVVAGGVIASVTNLDSLTIRRSEMFRAGPGGFLVDGAPIMELTGEIEPNADVRVNFEITPGIAFGARTPVVGAEAVLAVLIRTHQVIDTEVAGPLERFL